MKVITDTSQFIGGWFVGSFEPSAYKTTSCEVAYKTHYKDEYWQPHYHMLSDEVNYLIEGQMEINGQVLSAPCVFVIPRGETSRPIFHTDVRLIVVKVPGILNDKYLIEEASLTNDH